MSDATERELLRAKSDGLIDREGVRRSRVNGRRTTRPLPPRSRRRCDCGCQQRATHGGFMDGMCAYEGCEMSIRRWARDGSGARR